MVPKAGNNDGADGKTSDPSKAQSQPGVDEEWRSAPGIAGTVGTCAAATVRLPERDGTSDTGFTEEPRQM